MKNVIFAALAVLIATSLIAVPEDAMAFGFGVTGSFASGDLEANDDSIFGSGGIRTRYHQRRRSVGVVYDTNVGRDAIFNYRLGISYQGMKAKSSTGRFDLEGVSIENDFGFSLVRNETARFWVGPEVKVEHLEGTETFMGYRDHMGVLGVGLGPVAGLNLRLGDDISLIAKGGYIFQSGVRLFSEWDEKYGFITFGMIFNLGADQGDHWKRLGGKREE